MIVYRSIFDDPADVARHGTAKEEDILAAITGRFLRHGRLNPDCAQYRCEHGCYVGHRRALAYRCPFCPET